MATYRVYGTDADGSKRYLAESDDTTTVANLKSRFAVIYRGVGSEPK